MTYKAKGNRILQGQTLSAKRPWGLQQDGDMLQHIVDSRGRESMAITWVKGHATPEHPTVVREMCSPKQTNSNEPNDRRD